MILFKKIPLIFFIFIFCIALVSPLDTYEQNKEFTLKIPFEVNGTIPSAEAQCNLSLNYPNGTYLKTQNTTLNNQGDGYFNLTLIDSETKTLGIYRWVAFCCDTSARCASGTGEYKITPSGAEEITSGEGNVLIISEIIIVVIAILFFIAGLKIDYFAFKVIFIGVSMVMFLIAILFNLVILTQVFGMFTDIIEGYSTFFIVIKIIVSMCVLGLVLYSLYFSFKFWQWKRGLVD